MQYKNIYENPLAYGFKKNNCTVNFFKLNTNETFLSHRLKISFFLREINNLFVKKIKIYKPDIIFMWRSTTILANTIKKIKEFNPKTKIILYHNDNPYVGLVNKLKFRHFLNSIKYADITAAYRPKDFRFIKKLGAKKIKLLMPNYISYLHKPTNLKKKIDLLFIGHYSLDRENTLEYLCKKKIKLEIYGPGWQNLKSNSILRNIVKKEIINRKYVNKISEAKITISFLSKKNKDVYTRKCFEIPACGSILLAPKTKELQKLFRNKKEALFWSSNKDMLNIILKMINNKIMINKINKQGNARLMKDHHSEIDRALEILSW